MNIMYNPGMDRQYLQQALESAMTRRGYCAPNPAVGAVIVRDNTIVASGVHYAAGQDHAEVAALKSLASPADAVGATLYVTLEPCSHVGKTPPCTQAIIDAQLGRVVYGYRDPNPVVDGQGAAKLQAAGILCDWVPCPDIDDFYASYAHWTHTGRPWVTAKLAMSLDGKIAGPNFQRIDITGYEAKMQTYAYRKRSDALLTTANTLIADDPELCIRDEQGLETRPLYILDRSLRTPLGAKRLLDYAPNCLIHSDQCSRQRIETYQDLGVRCIALPEAADGTLSLSDLLDAIGKDGVHDLWVEAGPRLFKTLLKQDLIRTAIVYVAPSLIPNGTPAFFDEQQWPKQPSGVEWRQCGKDAILELGFADSNQILEVR